MNGLGYRYKHGDRPLEGYTIQRAAGRGGFGEVYFAISDSGREVALKAIQGCEQIELRGVSQCMNLKNPHLVTIFDVRHSAEGVPFVIMEYVNGPSLRQLLDESPGGLSTQKAAFFLREMGKGLSYLHDCGIIHRDLKPGNVFFETGTVKIGDYGLSKAITHTQHSCQTITVGTVHYMAPEIGMGRYDKGVDIYALGAVLFEMLTGQPPYLGGSPTEVLMKHLAGQPDVSGIEEPFATVIRKAMAKDPAHRYQSVQEMVEAVFGAEHVRNSVSVFRPEALSMVAERVGQRVVAGGSSGATTPMPASTAVADSWQAGRPSQPPPRPANRISLLSSSEACARKWMSIDGKVPEAGRILWIVILCMAAPLAIAFMVYANHPRLTPTEEAMGVGFSIGLSVLSIFSFFRLFEFTFKGWWKYMVRPLLLWTAIQCFCVAVAVKNKSVLTGSEDAMAAFFIALPIVAVIAIWVVSVRSHREPTLSELTAKGRGDN